MLINSFKSAIVSLGANKLRTFLTVLGIIIGISSVIIVYSAGEGINSLVVGQIESFGGNDLIQTEIKVPSSKTGGASETQSATNLAMGVQVTTLTMEDFEDISRSPLISGGYVAITGQERIAYGGNFRTAMVFGVSPGFIDIDRSEVDQGRFFTDNEDRSLAEVVVLGSKLKEDLFGGDDPIDRQVSVRNRKYRVVGVLKERGAVMGLDFDRIAYFPVRTLQKKVMGINHVLYMMHRVSDMDRLDESAEEIRYLLRENHGLPHPAGPTTMFNTGRDDFRVATMVESMEIMETVTGAITLLLLAIVAISLVVGGVGIMNIMYVAVSERTAEIGLRKAVGATYYNIMGQFLMESILITLLGGAVGVAIGAGASWLIALGAGHFGLDWAFRIPTRAYVVSLLFSLVFGLAFGLYPARQAARLHPIDALRKE